MKKVLITGGNGNLGFLAAERLAAQGMDIIRFDLPGSGREGPGIEILGDVRDEALLASAFTDHAPDAVIHLASLLSGSSEEDLDISWEINATTSFRLLRLAQDHKLSGPFVFASTIATYGLDLPDPLPGDTEQWPLGMYGATKVAVERLGWYFKIKHGLDFRCLRFPLVFSPYAPPSAMTAYPSHAFKAAAAGKPFTFPVSRDNGMSTLFLDDVVRCLCEIAQADKARLSKAAYNVHSFFATAGDVEDVIKTRWPEFQCDYVPNEAVETMLQNCPNEIDDSDARSDWDWAPEFDFQKSADAMFGIVDPK